MKALALPLRFAVVLALAVGAIAEDQQAPSVHTSPEDFARFARKLREAALSQVEPSISLPVDAAPKPNGQHPWKANIVAVLFHVGEGRGGASSAWDAEWLVHFGGVDDPRPGARRGYLPASFVPKENPFYVALPYNDIASGRFRPEAPTVIPWFRNGFVREGQSVCNGRWVAIRHGNRMCFAQWRDVGPHRSDHWEYVFGNERPKPNASRGAGVSISPAVRDFLGTADTDVVDWRFVEARDMPRGPWARWMTERNAGQPVATPKRARAISPDEPVVIQR
jgi:hypothetical protein